MPYSSMMEPYFSIILPTYNRAYILWRAIQSVLTQSEAGWELLVVNDGSTDDTCRLMEEFPNPRIRTFTKPHQGASAARNFGALQASNPYLCYLDSDNTWHPDFLSTMLYSIQSHPDGILWYCGKNTTMWRRSDTGERTIDLMKVDLGAQYTFEDVMQLKGPDTNCMVHKRQVWEKIGGWDEACSFLEDWDFFARCMVCYPGQLYWVPKVLVDYRQIHGVEVDGLCATSVKDPAMNVAQWQYLSEKWQSQPELVKRVANIIGKQ